MSLLHAMIDAETWGTSRDAAIRAVCLMLFRPDTGAIEQAELIDMRATLDEQIEYSRRVDGKTVKFWISQPRPLREYIQAYVQDITYVQVKKPETLFRAVEDITSFFNNAHIKNDQLKIWSRGSFDTDLLNHLTDRFGTDLPYRYWQARDVRTLDEITNKPKPGQPHDPVSDCEAQIRQVVNALKLARQPEAA